MKSSHSFVGTTQAVLVDGFSKKNERMLSGYTETNKLVHFKGDETLIGKIVNVRIVSSHVYSLRGEYGIK